MVVTLSDRKRQKVAHLRAATGNVVALLGSYAAKRSGRFLVFGSAARDDLRFDSDFDLLIDFPPQTERAARDYAERVAIEHGLKPDIHLMSEASAALMDRVRRDARVLG
ncbi:MAG TPA: nucleotidyltransferase domain-containing protein [Pararhizobium sp.]|nr:nucleotidyltransferase domain-containing protein [Pararhizobium sp.]